MAPKRKVTFNGQGEPIGVYSVLSNLLFRAVVRKFPTRNPSYFTDHQLALLVSVLDDDFEIPSEARRDAVITRLRQRNISAKRLGAFFSGIKPPETGVYKGNGFPLPSAIASPVINQVV
jgi:hypothetical protein